MRERIERERVADGVVASHREVFGFVPRADFLDGDVRDFTAAGVHRRGALFVRVRNDDLVFLRVDLGVGDFGERFLVGVERGDERRGVALLPDCRRAAFFLA